MPLIVFPSGLFRNLSKRCARASKLNKLISLFNIPCAAPSTTMGRETLLSFFYVKDEKSLYNVNALIIKPNIRRVNSLTRLRRRSNILTEVFTFVKMSLQRKKDYKVGPGLNGPRRIAVIQEPQIETNIMKNNQNPNRTLEKKHKRHIVIKVQGTRTSTP